VIEGVRAQSERGDAGVAKQTALFWEERSSGRFFEEWAIAFAATLMLLMFIDACQEYLR